MVEIVISIQNTLVKAPIVPDERRQNDIEEVVQCNASDVKMEYILGAVLMSIDSKAILQQKVNDHGVSHFVHPNPADLAPRCKRQITARADAAGHSVPHRQKWRNQRAANTQKQQQTPSLLQRIQCVFDLALCCHTVFSRKFAVRVNGPVLMIYKYLKSRCPNRVESSGICSLYKWTQSECPTNHSERGGS